MMVFLKLRRQLWRSQIFFAFYLLIFIFSEISLAITTSTLPEGRSSPSIRYGHIEGLDQRYTESGSLASLTDLKAIEFDAKTLAKFNSEAQALIASLNRFGGFNLGNSLNLGTLEIQSKPEINYTAAVFANGLTKNWTVALGIPVVHYKNQVKLSQSFSNINYYRSQFSGLSNELDQALHTNIGESTQQALVNKGYKRLDDRDQQFIGDVQLVSIYKLYQDTDLGVIYQATLNLPTGPQYDSSDLLALNTFHKTSLENSIAMSQTVGSLWRVVPYTSLKLTLPDRISARVPTNDDDLLPDQNSEETVQRSEGVTLEAGMQNILDLTDSFQLTLDYKLGVHSADSYGGAKSSRYDLLSKNTASRWQKVNLEFVYSTVQSYFKKTSTLPMMFSLNFFDTVAGSNIERRVGQEVSMTLFF